MARKRHHEEHVNHEAWAIPYGDLITLLLAFFVVMYAMSSVNEGKYRVLSDSLVAAFRGAPKSLQPIQIGKPAKSNFTLQAALDRTLVPLEIDASKRVLSPEERDGEELDPAYLRDTGGLTPDNLDGASALIAQISDALESQLSELVKKDLVRLHRNRFWVEIEINTSVLFASGSADIAPDAVPILERLSRILAGTRTRVQVEGHTDDRPISTVAYPSNWELSAARAASVVRLFTADGVAPGHMAAVGFGEFRPLADNATEAGRQQNRRVIIVVIARGPEHEQNQNLQASAAP